MHLVRSLSLATLTLLMACGGSKSTGSGSPSNADDAGSSDDAGTSGSTACQADTDCPTGDMCDTTTGFCSPASGTSCQQCACQDLLSAGGCANVCDSAQNGEPNTPNFCNGVSALPQCAKCLQDSCATAGADPTDPSGCM